jgi:hypothetical protein
MEPDRRKRRVARPHGKLGSSELRVFIAAVTTLTAVFGMAVAILGGLEFNRTKLLVGIGIAVVSTVVYIWMIFRSA